MNFTNLVSTNKGKDVCKELVAILLNKYIIETANVSPLIASSFSPAFRHFMSVSLSG